MVTISAPGRDAFYRWLTAIAHAPLVSNGYSSLVLRSLDIVTYTRRARGTRLALNQSLQQPLLIPPIFRSAFSS